MSNEPDQPPRIPPRLGAAPKVRQFLWCDFQKDAQLPEFWKTRPVLVLSYRNTLHGAVTVIPCSTHSQPQNSWAVHLEGSIDGQVSWAICDKITTVAVSRLAPVKGPIPRCTANDWDKVVAKVLEWLPKLNAPEPPVRKPVD